MPAKKPSSERRDIRLTFALNRDQDEIIRAAAEQAGADVSTFCRQAVMKRARKELGI